MQLSDQMSNLQADWRRERCLARELETELRQKEEQEQRLKDVNENQQGLIKQLKE